MTLNIESLKLLYFLNQIFSKFAIKWMFVFVVFFFATKLIIPYDCNAITPIFPSAELPKIYIKLPEKRPVISLKNPDKKKEPPKDVTVAPIVDEIENESIPKSSLPTLQEFKKKYIDNKLFENSKTWVVVIGIKDYAVERNGYFPLEYGVRDAVSIKNSLIVNWKIPSSRIYQLLNEQATKSNIELLLGDTIPNNNEIKENDRLLIYFSGHGQDYKTRNGKTVGYLIPYDGIDTNLYSTSISMSHIKEISQLIQARQLLFIIDSCYSGLTSIANKGKKDKKIDNLSKDQIITFRNSLGRQILTAGTSSQQALMGEMWDNHSVFTYYLLKGLKGEADYNKNGLIETYELHLYVKEEVVRATNGRQDPQLYSIGVSEGQFIFYPEGD